MGSPSQMTRAQQPQAEQSEAARIIKDLTAIEKAYFEACDELSDQMLAKLAEALRSAAPEPWQVVGNDVDTVLLSPDWRSLKAVGRGDAWFEIGEITEDDNDHSWIAAATGVPGTSMGLEFRTRIGLPGLAGVFAANSAAGIALLKHGFKQAESGARLFMPIVIDRDLLAKAFETGKFEEALAPAGKAVQMIAGAKAELDTLLALIRNKGKPR